jgi:flagellin
MRELAVQMENGIYTSKDRDNAQLEINALLQEIDKIAVNTRFNDVNLLDGNYDQSIRAGNTNAETIRVAIDGLKTLDTAKITQFSEETGTVETGASFGTDNTPAGATYNYNPAGGDTAVQKAMKAEKYNLSADGADGVDADGSDTDIEIRDGVAFAIDTSVFSSAFKEVFKSDSLGEFKLAAASGASVALDATTTDHNLFNIDAKTGRVTSKSTSNLNFTASLDKTDNTANLVAAKANYYAFDVQYWKRGAVAASHTEKVHLVIKEANETQLNSIQVESRAEASRAVETLDKALEQVSSAQAKLGAIQNRLQHNIDNLSKGAMLTEQAVGRVVDADFASETSSLSKQQILNQAATAMLAQANQSKQSVLSLLQ